MRLEMKGKRAGEVQNRILRAVSDLRAVGENVVKATAKTLQHQ